MSLREYKPRLSVEISEAQHKALLDLIPHNMRSPIIRSLIDHLIGLLRGMPDARMQIIGLVIANEYDVARATYLESKEAEEQRKEQTGDQ